MPLFDVIIATCDNLGELKQCLAGFEKQSLKDFRVFICVDGSTDGTLEYLRETVFSYPLEILQHERAAHRGRNATRNLALPHLSAEYLLTFDSDMVPDPILIETHTVQLKKQECVSLGAIWYLNQVSNFWADYIQSRGKNKYKHGDSLPPYYITTGNMAMPVRCFIGIGGQDEKMVTYGGGDTEFAYRLHQRYQLPVIYNSHAIGTAYMNKDWPEALGQMEDFGYRNLPYIREKHPEFHALFKADHLESKKFSSRLFRSVLSPFIDQSVCHCIKVVPSAIRRKLMHYLVFSRIARGYKRYLFEKKLILIIS